MSYNTILFLSYIQSNYLSCFFKNEGTTLLLRMHLTVLLIIMLQA